MTPDDEAVGTPEAADATDAGPELERLSALPLDERAAALAETVRRLEAELDATEANGANGALGADGTERAGPTRTSLARR